jgi:hypothetical protein
VLVLYDPGISMADIIAAMEQALDTGVRLHRKPQRPASEDKLDYCVT